jgi:hypothetical protein
MSHQRSTHESMSIEAAPLSNIIGDGEEGQGMTHSQGGWANRLVEETVGT